MRLAFPLIASGLALACGASNTQNQQTTSPPTTGHGQLALSLVDAPATQAKEIWVKVTEVNVHHSASGWVSVPLTFPQPPPAPQELLVDLLTLQFPNDALGLGQVDLLPGIVTQIRLVVAPDGNKVVLPDGREETLKVPSGAQSGIKIHGPWEITECNRTTLTIDFDAQKSIWYHPTSHGDPGDLWILRPVIRMKSEVVEEVGCETPPLPPEPVACDPVAPACDADEVCLPSTDPSLPGSFCAQPPGPESACSVGVECISGTCDATTSNCDASVPGQPCYADTDCQSNSCDLESHTCEQGIVGVPCADPDDCQSGLCDADTYTCTTEVCAVVGLPPGADCSMNDDCQSLVCGSDAKCSLNQLYDPCRPDGQDCDADENLYCDPDSSCVGTCMTPPSDPG
jgi:hypothetical protein